MVVSAREASLPVSAFDVVVVAACFCQPIYFNFNAAVANDVPEPTPPMMYDRMALMVGKSRTAAMVGSRMSVM